MAIETLLDRQMMDGEKLLLHLQSNHFDVTAASWVKATEDGSWYLYVASKAVDDNGLAEAYRELHAIIRAHPELCLEPFDVKLISPTHPVTAEIVGINDRYPAKIHTTYRLRELGGLQIGEAHIYPPLVPS